MLYTTEIHGRPRTTHELKFILDHYEFFNNDYLKPVIREWHKRQRK